MQEFQLFPKFSGVTIRQAGINQIGFGYQDMQLSVGETIKDTLNYWPVSGEGPLS